MSPAHLLALSLALLQVGVLTTLVAVPPLLLALFAIARAGLLHQLPFAARRAFLVYLGGIAILLVVHPERKVWLAQFFFFLIYVAVFVVARNLGPGPFCRLVLRWWLALTSLLLLAGLAGVPLFQYVAGYEDVSGWLTIRFSLFSGGGNKHASYLFFVSLVAALALARGPVTRLELVALTVLVSLSILTRGRDSLLTFCLLLWLGRLRAGAGLWSRIWGLAAGGLLAVIVLGCLTREHMVLPTRIDWRTPSLYRAVAHEPYVRAYWNATWWEKLVGFGWPSAALKSQEFKSRQLLERAYAPLSPSEAEFETALQTPLGPHSGFLFFLCLGGLVWSSATLVLAGGPIAWTRPDWSRPEVRLVALAAVLMLAHLVTRDAPRFGWFWATIALCQVAWLACPDPGREPTATG